MVAQGRLFFTFGTENMVLMWRWSPSGGGLPTDIYYMTINKDLFGGIQNGCNGEVVAMGRWSQVEVLLYQPLFTEYSNVCGRKRNRLGVKAYLSCLRKVPDQD